MSQQVKIINSIEYTRGSDSEFWHTKDKSTWSQIVCNCGNDAFKISYGNYECIGQCTKCEATDTLYDG